MTIKSRPFPSDKHPTNDIRNALRPERSIPALLAGVLISILQIALSISFAALIFRGEMTADLSRGIGMALFSAALGFGITSLLTSYPAILGGNQSNAVTVMRVARNRILDARWPSTAPPPSGITRKASKNGKVLSQNEA